MAEQAFRLLHDWDCVPGTDEGGKVSEAALREWCHRARSLAEKAGRLEVCENSIGELFGKSQVADEDGTWPCTAVRKVAEEIGADSLGSGMHCDIINSRGAVWRTSGDDQERELAEKFRQRADRIRFDTPFVARVLDSVAQSYEREAQWWAERDRWEE
jgi:hypothetical protein